MVRQVIPGLQDVLTPSFPEALAFDVLKQKFRFTIVNAKTVQQRDYDDPSKLLAWPSGDRMMMLCLIVNGSWEGGRAGTKDEIVERTIYIRGMSMTKALRDALRDAHVDGIAINDTGVIWWDHEEDVLDKKGKVLDTKRKCYEIELTPASD
jgi:hypothetical protein